MILNQSYRDHHLPITELKKKTRVTLKHHMDTFRLVYKILKRVDKYKQRHLEQLFESEVSLKMWIHICYIHRL